MRAEKQFLSKTQPKVLQSILWPSVWFLSSGTELLALQSCPNGNNYFLMTSPWYLLPRVDQNANSDWHTRFFCKSLASFELFPFRSFPFQPLLSPLLRLICNLNSPQTARGWEEPTAPLGPGKDVPVHRVCFGVSLKL